MKSKKQWMLASVLVMFASAGGSAAAAVPDGQSLDRPNIVVIMTDDLGFSDIGCYGSEIETPNLDALAADGLRFSQFYNTGKCHSSRVSLLTGQYCIAAGDTALSHAVTSAELLKEAGYFTAMTGKWHLKKEPTDFGFERYFGHLSGATNFFKGDKTFRLNGEPWKVPASDFYTTVADVDFALEFLKEARKSENPFYLYVAFNAPHAPLHALPEDYAKYKGRYDSGWDKIRDARIAKQKELGLLPKNLKPSPRPSHVRAWDKLVPWQRDFEINRMVTLAAMIDRVDQEVGRLVEDLKNNGELENTMILFVSDNGACPYDRKAPQLNVEPTNGNTALGDSTGWAWARNAPFRFYKQNQFEGGISTPGIVHWPAGLKTEPGSIVDEPVHLIDVLPTLADLSGATIPTEHPTRALRPVSGISLRPILEGKALRRSEPIYLQFAFDWGLRDGDWKLVNFKGQEWELYNLANDRTELTDLAKAEPERLKNMIAKWRAMSANVLHLDRLANATTKPAEDPKSNREWTVFSDSDEPPKRAPRKKRERRTTTSPEESKPKAGHGVTILRAEDSKTSGVDFENHILPIFQASCFDCHNDPAQRKGKKPKGGLRLDSREYIRAGGNNGALFVAGDPDDSLLYQLIILQEDDDDVMPANGELLTKGQIALIRRWIESGGNFGAWEGVDGADVVSAGQVKTVESLEVAVDDENASMPVNVAAFAREIDQLVTEELKRLDQSPRPQIDDYTFCRRVYIDAIGRIPTIDELESFVGDEQSDKRVRLIDKLLRSKGYNSHWYNYWADLLRVKDVGDKLHHSGNFSEWIKDSVRRNKPYNQIAHELINASGELYKPGNGATGFYAREPMPLDHLANSVKTFMGMSIECAQCHDHPYEDWTQQDFYKLAAFTSKTHLRVDPLPKDEKETYAKERRILKQRDFDEWIVYRESIRVKHAAIYGNGTGFMRLPHDYQYKDGEPHQVMEADILFGNMPKMNYQMTKEKLESLPKHHFGPGINARSFMADWMTSADNPMFTKATVNRLWHKIMGTELAGQLGGLTNEEMGNHPALTRKLISIMKASKYDTKVFLSALFNSRTYQGKALASSATPPAYVLDGPVVRRLAAEVIVDSYLSLKTETPDKYVATEFRWDGFTHFYEKSQDMTVKDFVDYSIEGPGRGRFQAREEREAMKRNGDMGPYELWRVSTFGRNYKNHWIAMLMGKSNRELIDDANLEPDIPQILFMMNGHGIPEDALIHRKLGSAEDHREKMEILWKSILGRLPKDSEEPLFKNAPDDVMWALLNSNEFRFGR